MNKQKGNMYPFVTHTWNPIRGKCPHECSYCYMKVFPQKEMRLDEKALKEDLGRGNYIFVGSSTDMWAVNVPSDWIDKVLCKCLKYDNRYLFQSKNAMRFLQFSFRDPFNTRTLKAILGTTIETNRWYDGKMGLSISPILRWQAMKAIQLPKMVSIEPIMDFDLYAMVSWIKEIKPEFVSIGADSKGHKLPEPPASKVQALIKELQGITTVKIKDNLSRIS